jgi:hypothetical protein
MSGALLEELHQRQRAQSKSAGEIPATMNERICDLLPGS